MPDIFANKLAEASNSLAFFFSPNTMFLWTNSWLVQFFKVKICSFTCGKI